MPIYQIVRDIMNAYKLKKHGKKKLLNDQSFGDNWGISLIGGAVGSALLRQSWNWDFLIIIFSYVLDILEYVLFIVLLTKIQNMQKSIFRKLLKYLLFADVILIYNYTFLQNPPVCLLLLIEHHQLLVMIFQEIRKRLFLNYLNLFNFFRV